MIKGLRAFARRLAGFLGIGRTDGEFAEELDTHLQMQIDDNLSAGMTPEQARRRALLTIGGIAAAKDRFHDRRSLPLFETVAQDLRHGARLLRASPGITALGILTLAIGIGASTAIFSVVNGVLLKAPYPDADRLVWMASSAPQGGTSAMSTLDYLDVRRGTTAVQSIAGWVAASWTLTDRPLPRQVRLLQVSPAYFDFFGMKPRFGRVFAEGEDRPETEHVAVLSHGFWASEFGSDPGIVGRSIRLRGDLYQVVGVMTEAAGADWGWTEAWIPLAFHPENLTRSYYWIGAYGRLKPGATIQEARAELNGIAQGLARDHPDTNQGRGFVVEPYSDSRISSGLRQSLLVLLAAAGMVLLAGCANVSSLMLTKGAARAREVAIRSALGGGRWRIVRQLLAEYLLLSFAGGVAGLVLASGIMAALRFLLPPFSSPMAGVPPQQMVAVDGGVLLFAFLATAASGLLCGVVPALAATRRDLVAPLKGAPGGIWAAARDRRLRSALVGAEVAIATVLLSTAGVLLHSFFNMEHAKTGFDSTNVVVATVPMTTEDALETPAERGLYFGQLLDRIRVVPGVGEAALTSALPMDGPGSIVPFQRASTAPVDLANRPLAFFKMVTPSYMPVLGLAVKSGRPLMDDDAPASPHVALVNETLASRYFRHANPIGQRLLIPEVVQTGRARLGPDAAWEIVGVVADERIGGLGARAESPGIYVTLAQSPTRHPSIVLRTNGRGMAIQDPLRRAAASVNGGQPLTDIRPLDEMKAQSIAPERTRAEVLAVFALAALLLSAVGIYGVMSYAVVERTRELGLRVALGATKRTLVASVVGHETAMAAVGVSVGVAAAPGLNRLLGAMLFGVGAADPITLAATVATLVAATAVAVYVPARRAAHIDPLRALRGE